VSGKFIDEFQMACTEDVKSNLKLMMGHVHVYVTAACKEYFEKFRRHVYVTPRSYLSFIQGYKELYSKKWACTQELAVSIQVGLAATAEDCDFSGALLCTAEPVMSSCASMWPVQPLLCCCCCCFYWATLRRCCLHHIL
jgi:hypothetical protein